MIYLDTHTVVWLYDDYRKISQKALKLIEDNELIISDIVKLELHYLFEIQRINTPASALLEYLNKTVGLKINSLNFGLVIEKSLNINWTRDVFDRIIVASAIVDNTILISKDTEILKHYNKAVW